MTRAAHSPPPNRIHDGGRRVLTVCLELTHGPIVSALLEHDFFVLFPVQPATLARYRNAFTTSRAKDDPTDAEIALELLLRHPDKLSRLKPESVAMRSLRRLVEARRSLVDDRVRLTNRSFLNSARACAAIELFDVEIGSAPSCRTMRSFRPCPAAGPALAPRLLVAFGERRERFPNAAALQKYAGVAPVTERSGNTSWVHWRYSCPKFLRRSFIEWVAQTIPRSFWAQAFYKSCRARGMRHQAALRALAFKWIRILRCWVERTPYDESRYLLALQKRQAPLLKFAAAPP